MPAASTSKRASHQSNNATLTILVLALILLNWSLPSAAPAAASPPIFHRPPSKTPAIPADNPDFTLTMSHPTPVDAGQTANSTIIVNSLNDFAGLVILTYTADPGLKCTIMPDTVMGSGTATVSCTANNSGDYALTINGTSTSPILTHTANATFQFTTPPPDFSLHATNPAPVPADGIMTATSTITILPTGGFTGTVDLTTSQYPSGLTCTGIIPPSIPYSDTATLTCTSTTAKTYTITITGTSGTLTHTADARFSFTPPPDFSISAVGPVGFASGSIGTSTVTLDALNGFNNPVSLTATISPSTGLNVTLSQDHFLIGQGTTTATFTSSTTGSYKVTLTATGYGKTHTAIVNVTVNSPPDFTLTASPALITLHPDDTGTSTITITPSDGFSGTVSLTASVSPSGPIAGLSSLSISQSGLSTLTVKVESGTATGTYVITVSGTSGYQIHTTTVTITVSSPMPAANVPSILGLDPTTFYTLIAGIIIVAAAGIVLIRRSRKPRTD